MSAAQPSDPWRALSRELDLWAASGEPATFWWRDDDATAPSPALEQLLGLGRTHQAPLALAVVPAVVDDHLSKVLETASPRVSVLQHGFSHSNHRAGPGKKIELTSARRASKLCAELSRGRDRLGGLFGDRFLPVLVPPWNRIDAEVAGLLPALGFRGLSTYGPRLSSLPISGLRRINCHVDIMRWSDPRGFLGLEPALGLAVGHLRARRQGNADRSEPTGLLTHHLVHDQSAWAFLTSLLAFLVQHPAARILDPADIFAAS